MPLPALSRWMYRGHRPNALARAMNDVSAAIHALGIAPDNWITLQVIGRRTGRIISFPLVMQVMDGERYLVSMLGEQVAWIRNMRATNGHALLRHGRVERVQLEDVPVEQRAPIIRAYLQIAPGARPHIPIDKAAPIEEFEAIAAQIPVFRVRPAA